MHEKIPNGPAPEQQREDPVFSEEERLEQFIKDHPELFIAPLENRRECGPEIEEFEKMIDAFEAKYPLAELYSIVDLSLEEDPFHHPVREPAQLALEPIYKKMRILRDETNISPEKYKELEMRRNNISNAVGLKKDNKIYHDKVR